MGKHAKPKVKGGKHAKPTTHPIAKKAGVVGAAAAAVPMAGLIFAGPASAATMGDWNATSIPEAGGDWCIDHSSDGLSVGGLQFQNPSWHDALQYLNAHGHDTSQWQQNLSQYMGRDNVPSKDQQVLAGEALLHIQGPGAWANGNFQGGASMFDGGANPWGLFGTTAPAGIEAYASCTGSTPTPPPVPDPTPTPVPVPVPGHHHWRHHHHHGWHHKPVTPPPPVVPPVTPTPDPAPPVAGAECDHIVVPGDTVSGVAASVGAPLADVEAVNPGIVHPPRPGDYSLIFSGGHIHMPAGFCAAGE